MYSPDGRNPEQSNEGRYPFGVLIVDDTYSVRVLLKRLLLDAGIQVVGEAVDGERAIRAVEKLRPDLVIMDHRMPRRDGADATREIKRRWPELDVYAYTSSTYAEASAIMVDAGASATFDKFDFDELIQAIQRRASPGGDRSGDQWGGS